MLSPLSWVSLKKLERIVELELETNTHFHSCGKCQENFECQCAIGSCPKFCPSCEPQMSDQEIAVASGVKKCPECDAEITEENPLRDDEGCEECTGECSKCGTVVATENLKEGSDCDKKLCDSCVYYCQCCGEYLCSRHRDDHGT